MFNTKYLQARIITRGKKQLLLSVFLLLSLTIIFSGCDKQNNNAIKVDEPTGSKTESVIKDEQPKEENKSSGVLLGIKSREENSAGITYTMGIKEPALYDEKPQYKTLYITNNKGNVTLSAQGSGVLVPRNDDFWLLNIETERLKDKYKDFDYESNIDFISTKKANSKSVKKSIKKYKPGELAKKWCEPYISGDPKYFDNNVCLELIFVGNEYITQRIVNYGYNGGVRGRDFNWLITIPFNEANKIDVCNDYIMEIEGRTADNVVKGVSISELLGNNAKAEFFKEGNAFLENEKLTNNYCLQEGDWGLFRQNGKWVVKGYLLSSTGAGRGTYGIFDTNIIPTKQIVSHDTLIPNWNVIKTLIPNAKDAFSSPEEDMLIVLTPKELRVYTDFKDEYIGEVAYVIDLGDIVDLEEKKEVDVIMAQWATGNYVEKWANAARTYLKNN